jgi:colanic acid/amylovoran biosynthesis protein
VTSRRRIKIGLLWHSDSSGNLGVGALTLANIAIVRGVAQGMGLEPEFLLMGMRESGQAYVGPDQADVFVIDARSMLKPSGFWRAVGEQDCILDIGGGDSFTDIYATRRYLYIWATKMMVIGRRVPLLLSPQTIGPFSKTPQTQMAQLALRGMRAVVVRDRPSFDAVSQLAPRARCVLSTDVAFALPYQDRSAERGGRRLRVGVNVSGLLFGEALSGRNKFGLSFDYAAVTRQFIQGVLARGDADVHLLTHATTTDRADDDGWAVDQVAGEFPGTVRVPDFVGPSEAKSYISSLDFLTAGRMHACIGALSSLTPVVPIAYSRKFRGVFGMLDYPWFIDTQGHDTDGALALLNDGLDRRAELAVAATDGMRRVQPLLDAYRNELEGMFAGFRQEARAA